MTVVKDPLIRLVCSQCRTSLSYSLFGTNYRLDVLLKKVIMNVKTCSQCKRPLSLSSIKMSVKE